MKQLYLKATPNYRGRFTVPVFWDKKSSQIVNNESPEIIKFINKEFDSLSTKKFEDIYP